MVHWICGSENVAHAMIGRHGPFPTKHLCTDCQLVYMTHDFVCAHGTYTGPLNSPVRLTHDLG